MSWRNKNPSEVVLFLQYLINLNVFSVEWNRSILLEIKLIVLAIKTSIKELSWQIKGC